MKRYIYILLAGTLAALAGCIHDTPYEGPQVPSDGTVSLKITLPPPVAKTLGGGTRGVEDFEVLNDVNIVIASGEDDAAQILSITYFTLASPSLPTGVEYTAEENGFGVHFPREWFETYDIPSETIVFFVVGNYGSQVDVATVGDLRGLQIVSDVPGSPGNRNILFGVGVDLAVNDPDHFAHVGEEGHEGGRTLRVELARQAVMITIKIDGSGLSNDIEIIPTSISLHNVPLWSYLGKDNDIDGVTPPAQPSAGNNPNMALNGESFRGALLDWGSLGTMPGGTSGMGNPVHAVVGGHYTDGSSDGNTPDYTRTDIHALFMLENIHGTNFGADNAANQDSGRGKRPWYVVWSATETAQNEAALMAAANALACSYLEVRAEYYRYSGSSVAEGGEVVYRVFLGGDIYQNFDVKRNTYYRFTLDLNGGAISEGDFSWRLDAALSTSSVLDESDFVLNAAGEMIIIDELAPKPNESNWGITYESDSSQRDANGNTEYLWMVYGDGGTKGWHELPLDTGRFPSGQGAKLMTSTSSGNVLQYRLYVDPMAETDGVGDNQGYVRRVAFTLHNNSGYTSDVITITQYGPVVTSLTAENTPDEIEEYITSIGKSLPMTVYLDRIDREALPWGFDGATITNAGSGFANGLNLVNGAGYASVIEANYLPFGKPSAMMHAAFMNYYQWEGHDGFIDNAALTPAPTLFTVSFYAAQNYTEATVPNSIPSSEEWRLLEMLDEAGFDVFDRARGHDIIPWQPYWTSDAVEKDNVRSYVYRRNLAGGITTSPRTTPTPYRLVHFEYAQQE